ncbi:MAG: hypothetical protein ACRCS8_05265 [Brevinema sp.]
MTKRLVLLASMVFASLQVDTHAQSKVNLSDAEVPVMPSRFLLDTKPTRTAQVLPLLQKQFRIPTGMFPNPIGISFIYNYTSESYAIKSFTGEPGPAGSALGIGSIGMNRGFVSVESHAIGAKVDVMLLPFLQIFGLAAYLKMDQVTTIDGLRATSDGSIGGNIISGTINNLNIGFDVVNSLEGFVGMGGMNLMFGYKGFFLSFMLSGGYVRLDDNINNVKGFVEKPIMYVAPRIGYQYKGIFNVFTGVQYVELFGATKGADLSASTGGLVKSFHVGLDKFPVNFMVGMQFTPIREFSIGIEYVGSPDVNGLNLEIGGRF